MIAAAVAIACWRLLDQRTGLSSELLPGVNPKDRTDFCLDALFIGSWVALMADAYRQHFDRWPVLLIGYAGFLIIGGQLVGYSIPVFLFNLAISFVLITTVLHPQTLIGRLLEFRPLRWIGRLSYSLYLWQQLFCVPHPGSSYLGLLHRWPWNLAATFGCAILSYYLLEQPMIRLGHRLHRPATAGCPEDEVQDKTYVGAGKTDNRRTG